MSETKQIKITLVRSLAKKLKNHQACVHGLGLRRMNQSVVVAATPENMGMVRKASYLLKIEEL
ncbi:MAG: 50S ribosomal protein L30 [Sinimarinibacterium flocculans]|uniref:Large ribosomal subunit protein uL30 n=1 Tax=Sinimarinibacterium flocculans TaxID=985250 RepID=A0A318EBA3_9GAMM|nr:50S ribosomal protein L30 [Sinimarinibacterium flocculans]MEC9362003.1 50S ribosomal protein L30 [Pseudomonadota bacterium]PXV69857.1 LSU ribosomal protein L30P [Sinimarinibacterium flocculans]